MSHRKYEEFNCQITTHLKSVKNKVLCEVLAEAEGFNSISEWTAHVIENEILPKRLSKITNKGVKENESN